MAFYNFSDDFVKNHLFKSTNDPHFTRHHLFTDINSSSKPIPIFNICSLHSLLNKPVSESFKIDSPNKRFWSAVVGYCNGLVCLNTSIDRIFLWNPSTRKSRKLPRLPVLTYMPGYYFCYDEWDNDFKVFGACSEGGIGTTDICVMFFYSSKSDCWRTIGDFPFHHIQYGAVYAKGAFYWVVDLIMQNSNVKDATIISLDIKTGTYRQVLQPMKYAEGTYYATFGTFDKSLSVCYNVIKETRADFWVMNNCGVEESWIKLFTISYGNGLPADCYIKPLCICVNVRHYAVFKVTNTTIHI